MFQSPSDVAFEIFGFPVYFYGIILAIAVLFGFFTASFMYKKFYEESDASKILDMAPWLVVFGILGARIYYCCLNFNYYFLNPAEILNIRQGGLSVHGMIFAGILALYLLSKYSYKISFLKTADSLFCAMPLAQSLGRWGNFFNSEAFGMPTNLPWKLFIPISERPPEYVNFEYFHPTFLYESLLDLLIFFILYLSFKKLSKKSGRISCLYLILYSIARILVESLRLDSALNLFGFPVAIWISFLLFIVGTCGLIILNRCQKV